MKHQTSRTFCLTDWARQLAPRRPPRTPRPRHRLLHRLKRVWRWVAHPRRDPVALQLQALPWLWQALGRPRQWVVVDWTYGYLNTVQGKVLAVQIFCLALLGRHRALPLLQVAYDRENLPLSQNGMERTLLAAFLDALPSGVEVVLLLDRGFDRAELFAWLKERGVPFVVRLRHGTWIEHQAHKGHEPAEDNRKQKLLPSHRSSPLEEFTRYLFDQAREARQAAEILGAIMRTRSAV